MAYAFQGCFFMGAIQCRMNSITHTTHVMLSSNLRKNTHNEIEVIYKTKGGGN